MYLNATIFTPVGEFFGTINDESITMEDCERLREGLQIHPLSHIVLKKISFGTDIEMTFPEGVLNNSVIQYSIQDFTWAGNQKT